MMNEGQQPSGQEPSVEVSLLLPAYNEEKRIAGTIASAVGYFEKAGLAFEILVIADGTDRTRDIVSELASKDARIRVMGGKERRGKGGRPGSDLAKSYYWSSGTRNADRSHG